MDSDTFPVETLLSLYTTDNLSLAKFRSYFKRNKIIVQHPIDLLGVISYKDINNAICLAGVRGWESILIIHDANYVDVLVIKELDGNKIKTGKHVILKSICKEAIEYEREGYITLIDIYDRLLISKDGETWELTKVTIKPSV